MPSFPRVFAAVSAALLLAACATEEAPGPLSVSEAAQRNRNGFVSEEFRDRVIVLREELDVLRELYPDSEALIVADESDSAQLRAASLAVMQHVPMLTYRGDARELAAEVSRLGVRRVLAVGEVPGGWQGSALLIRDPGTTAAMGKLTAFQPTSVVVGKPENMVAAVAGLDPRAHTELKAAWEPLVRHEEYTPRPLPAQSRRDGQMSPVMIATPGTPVALVATARAYGADVRVLSGPDPRESRDDFLKVAGLEDGPLVALGAEFGDANLLADRIRQGWHE